MVSSIVRSGAGRVKATKKLDARGMTCPQPILFTRAILQKMKTGKVLQVTTTDPGSLRDIKTFCMLTDNTLLSSSQTANEFIFLIQKH